MQIHCCCECACAARHCTDIRGNVPTLRADQVLPVVMQCMKNPVPIGIGYLAQYIVKPLLGFCIAKVGFISSLSPQLRHYGTSGISSTLMGTVPWDALMQSIFHVLCSGLGHDMIHQEVSAELGFSSGGQQSLESPDIDTVKPAYPEQAPGTCRRSISRLLWQRASFWCPAVRVARSVDGSLLLLIISLATPAAASSHQMPLVPVMYVKCLG